MSLNVPDRVDQLLGMTALAATDRLRAAVATDPDLSQAQASALVHLQARPAWLGRLGDDRDRVRYGHGLLLPDIQHDLALGATTLGAIGTGWLCCPAWSRRRW